jgi:hypothetical protein
MALTETLDTYLADFGVSVSFSGSTAGMLGIEDAAGVLSLESEQFPGVQQTKRSLLIRTDQKGALVPGSSITVNATSRTVIYLSSHEDGAFTLVWLH